MTTLAKEDIEIMHRFFQTEKAPFDKMVDRLLVQYEADYVPVRMVFFGASTDNREYLIHLSHLQHAVNAAFGPKAPLVSYVAQPVGSEGMALEVHEVMLTELDTFSRHEYKGIPYILVERKGCRRLFLSGVVGDVLHGSISQQSHEVFGLIGDLLQKERMPVSSIVRQWNYIEKITTYDADGHQHYQDFNDARTLFYETSDWPCGYPSATGIGTEWGGIMIDLDALLCDDGTVQVVGVDNPLQVAAHAYSQDVLLGKSFTRCKTTPKFERAKAVWKKDHGFIYVSGTAAIRGELSLENVDITVQTETTLDNITYLVSAENLRNFGIPVQEDTYMIDYRVYVKYKDDLEKAREVVKRMFPDVPAIYTLTDVCRTELLIEIEGVGIIH